MSQILLLQSSLNGPASRTNQLMERFLQTRREQGHQDQVVVRDLTALDLPALDSPLFHALRGAEPANEAIRQAVALSVQLPVIVYNVPSRTGLNLLPETALELSKLPRINGIKEASGNLDQVAKVHELCGDALNIWSGNDDQTAAIMARGGSGVISVVSNVAPEAVVTLPVGVLRSGAVTITPPLPPVNRDALGRLRMNAFEKVFLRFPVRFWDDDVYAIRQQGPAGDWWHSWYDLTALDDTPTMLTFAAGPAATATRGRSRGSPTPTPRCCAISTPSASAWTRGCGCWRGAISQA